MNDQNLEVLPPAGNVPAVRDSASDMMRRATDVAGVCREIVLKTACNIQGKKYIKCEGWMSIATAHGCIAGSRDVKKVEGGYTAIGEIRRISDGAIMSTAEGFVGTSEKRWGQADEYACRAMAQTRAISRACRAAFAHVVVLMDAGLSTTPAEEVPDGGFVNGVESPTRPPCAPRHLSRQSEQNAGNRQPEAVNAPSDGSLTEDLMLDSYKRVDSKAGAPKKWTAWFITFSTDSGQTFEVGTFDAALAGTLAKLAGQVCTVTHRPGKKAQTRELVSIEPAAEAAQDR